MWTFSGYEKIAESVAKWNLDVAGTRALRRVRWAVTEKIHGANFCFVVESGRIHGQPPLMQALRGANRRHLLGDDEPFFGWQTVRETLADSLKSIAARLPDAEAVCVYGELFGGGYPHGDIAPVSGTQPVQTSVWYAPEIRFAAFDVAVTEGGTRRYLDFEQAQRILLAAGVPCVAPLFTGSFERATDFSPRFDSTIPKSLGLPALPTGTNLAEGIVVRPMREIAGLAARPLLKIKIAEFAEDIRFHEAQKWDAPTGLGRGYNDSLNRLKWVAYNRVTENRLNAAISKVGNAPEKRGEVCALLLAEVEAEAREVDAEAWNALTEVRRGEWQAYVRTEVRALLQSRWKEDT